MKKKVNRRSSVAELLETPLPMGASPLPNDSPRSAIFINKKATASASKVNKDTSLPSATKTLSSISDLKDPSSRLDHLKRHIDHSHSEILKDLDASQSRLHKRFKLQTQGCQQVIDEAEKEYKKMLERISESRGSNEGFIRRVHSRCTGQRISCEDVILICKAMKKTMWMELSTTAIKKGADFSGVE